MTPTTCGHWINGQETAAADGDTFEVLNPLDDSRFVRAALATEADVDAAVNAAHCAFSDRLLSSPGDRERWLIKAADLLQRDAPEFEALLIDEIGSPVRKAKHEIVTAIETLRAAAGIPRQMAGKMLPTDTDGRISLSQRSPLGVVAGITPFNVPLIKAVKHSAMPLATGNTVVLLPSEEAPTSVVRLARLYAEAGIPKGAMNVVCGRGYEIGDALVTHPAVRMVGFTGSTRVGRHIHGLCGQHGKRVTLELGGKNSLIVLADANIDAAMQAAVPGSFLYQGQICLSSSRIFVERPVADAFLARFCAVAGKLPVGDPRNPDTVVGPIINQKQRARIRSHIQDAVDKGATIRVGGDWEANCCQPTILTGVNDQMLIHQQETFGPVTSVYIVDTAEEAVCRANESSYGLVASVYTSDVDAALSFADRLDVGMVHINGQTIQQEPQAPFGGVGDSGFGREGTDVAIDEMTQWKWITIDRSGGN